MTFETSSGTSQDRKKGESEAGLSQIELQGRRSNFISRTSLEANMAKSRSSSEPIIRRKSVRFNLEDNDNNNGNDQVDNGSTSILGSTIGQLP